MVEIGVGFAIFAFLPWCQLQRGHVAVDLFRPAFGEVANRLIDVVVDILILGLAIMIAWRLFEGMLDKRQFAETTFILRLPIWQAYLAGLAGAGSFVLVAAFCALRSLRSLKNGARDVKP
jgi:TRAP-type C4-dicarboxylate transport system permease small subunit